MPQFNVGDRVVSSVNAQGLVRDVATYEVVDVAKNATPFGVFVTYRVTRIDQPDDRMLDIGNGHLVLRAAPGGCFASPCVGCRSPSGSIVTVDGDPLCAACRDE